MPCRLTLLVATVLLASSPLMASEVRVWGDHANVQSYDLSEAVFNVPAELATVDVVDLVVAGGAVCALTADKRVIVWGGMGDSYQRSLLAVPSAVQGHVVKVAAGPYDIMALTDTGSIVGWGQNDHNVQTTIPTNLTGVTDLAVGGFGAAFAVTTDGSVSSWGYNQVPAPTGTVVAAVTGTDGFAVFIRKSDHLVQSWGTPFSSIEIPPAGLFATILVDGANLTQYAAVKLDTTLVLWGNNTAHITEKVPVGLNLVAQVALGDVQGLVRRTDGSLVTWGDGVTPSSGLEIPSGLAHARIIGAGFGFSVAVISAPPTALQWQHQPAVTGGAASGTVIGNVITSDPDSTDTFTYALVAGDGATDNGLFSLTGSQVIVATTLPGAAATRTIRVRSTDSGGQSLEKILAVPVQADPHLATDDSKSGPLGCGVGGRIGVLIAGLVAVLTFDRRNCTSARTAPIQPRNAS